ncbi:hypothetical protein LJR231_002042 [Phyllobacterium sp. LjRoot231]|uniref:hypothetical protein n=1 Tax=Phyllobacterium sp. LjRoot231 TaxID=3342289 RepID=UPI003ED0386D
MPGTIGPNPKLLLSVMGALEAATGLVLLVTPSVLVELLLGAAPGTPAGVTVSRVAGVALLALGVACWLARADAASHAAKGLGRGNVSLQHWGGSGPCPCVVAPWAVRHRSLACCLGPCWTSRLVRRVHVNANPQRKIPLDETRFSSSMSDVGAYAPSWAASAMSAFHPKQKFASSPVGNDVVRMHMTGAA